MNLGRDLGSEGARLGGGAHFVVAVLSCCKNPAEGVLSVSLAGVEEVWGVVLQRAAQVHHSFEEQQQQAPGAADPALAGRGGARTREPGQQPLLHLGQGKRLVIPPRTRWEKGLAPSFLLAASQSQGILCWRCYPSRRAVFLVVCWFFEDLLMFSACWWLR